jgi:queuine tRNA-ribosyltransferase
MLTPVQLKEAGSQIILSNTFHLTLRPGEDIVHNMGGLHKFMGWNSGPMLTDSGGFQVFSLGGHGGVTDEMYKTGEIKCNRNFGDKAKTILGITEEGAKFKSYVDGSVQMLSPERSIQIQRKLGADFILNFDECTPFNVSKNYPAESMHGRHRWAKRCIYEFERTYDLVPNNGSQALFGIVQGGGYEDLRKISGEFMSQQDFFGIAVGGSLGDSPKQMYEVVEMAMKYVRADKPVHLLGIGGVHDIWEQVLNGIDSFDCVSPTRMARHGAALLKLHPKERINLKNTCYKNDDNPNETDCDCWTCRNLSRGYLHYLYKADEPIVQTYAAIHNIHFMNKMMERIRFAIENDCYEQERAKWVADMDHRELALIKN